MNGVKVSPGNIAITLKTGHRLQGILLGHQLVLIIKTQLQKSINPGIHHGRTNEVRPVIPFLTKAASLPKRGGHKNIALRSRCDFSPTIINFLQIIAVPSFEESLDEISMLSGESKNAFIEAWKEWKVPKDYFLVKENAVADYIFFIKKGIARIYYYKNEKEITEWIAMDESYFLSIISFFERKPSKLIIQTIEPSEVLGIHYNDLMQLADTYHDVERLFRKMLSRSLILSQYRMDSIQFETAQQRYEKLLQENPAIIQRVPLAYIASFLGITQETLSRIRSGK